MLGKTFRLFVNQKVPDMGVIGGKFQGLFPTPHTRHPTNKLIQQTLTTPKNYLFSPAAVQTLVLVRCYPWSLPKRDYPNAKKD
ncbi:MAG: hypothetical protein DWQ58_23850 [Microcystis aeruginosa TA09]|nr:MAG: hypothetical protein DWQ58_23850 [Microcystis aeruginosa TA09]